MKTELYWLQGTSPGRLAIMPRPRGGDWLEDEVRAWRLAGVDIIVSLLTADEIVDLDLAYEEKWCQANGIQYLSFPISDRSVPFSKEAVLELVATLAKRLAEGASIAIHCRQGIGRAALVALCVLTVMGMDPETTIRQVSAARGCPVPETVEQRQWVMDFAKPPLAASSR